MKSTGLSDFLKNNKIDQVFIVGLATDYCVKFTAFDAVAEGFETYVFIDGTKAVNLQPGDYEKAIRQMQTKGIKILESSEIK